VSLDLKQLLVAGILGLLIATAVARSSRRGLLSFRYTLGWLCVASLGMLSGLLVPVVEPVATAFGLSSAALVGLAALMMVTIITIQLSISISGLQRQVRVLAEEIARLRRDAGQRTDHTHHKP